MFCHSDNILNHQNLYAKLRRECRSYIIILLKTSSIYLFTFVPFHANWIRTVLELRKLTLTRVFHNGTELCFNTIKFVTGSLLETQLVLKVSRTYDNKINFTGTRPNDKERCHCVNTLSVALRFLILLHDLQFRVRVNSNINQSVVYCTIWPYCIMLSKNT